MGFPLFQVDAFTRSPFSGNPAAVCLLPAPQPDRWMQQLAQEMNLSETAFLLPRSTNSAQDGFQLRWFTPTVEVDLCGHATLASAHILWQEGLLHPEEPAQFYTRSGLLTATQQGEWIEMDFPQTLSSPIDPPQALLDALGISPSHVDYVGKNAFDYLVVLDTPDRVCGLAPQFAQLRTLPVRGIIVTSLVTSPWAAPSGQSSTQPEQLLPQATDETSEYPSSDQEPDPRQHYDFVSRFFAPGSGIDEDPVTGSAHCALAPFWGHRLSKTTLTGYQASARGGVVKMRWLDDRVLLSGQAVTVFRGQLG